MKASVLRYAAIGMASLSLAGFAAASSVTVGGVNSGTGADSTNKVNLNNSSSMSSNNWNVGGVTNATGQAAASGHVSATKNTDGTGPISSGDAMNESDNHTEGTIDNTVSGTTLGALAGLGTAADYDVEVSKTGADSTNRVDINNSSSVEKNNANIVNINNSTSQSAASGSVNAYKNTEAGSVQSGDASNSSTNFTSFKVTN